MSKPFKNSLTEWALSDGRIRGRVRFNQNIAGVLAGQMLVTSTVVRIYQSDGKRWAETANSLYILED